MLGSIIGALGSVAGGLIGASTAKDQMEMQEKFAKKGVQWKVADSLKAGIHPLYGLGANTLQYSPVAVGDYGVTGALSEMGQGVDRAMNAASGPGTRLMAKQLEALTLEKAGLENDLLRSQIRRMNAPGTVGPPMPGLIPVEHMNPQLTKGVNIGRAAEANPYFSDAQSIEDRYGDSEILSMLSAIVNGGADMYWNLYRPGAGKARPFRNPNLMGGR